MKLANDSLSTEMKRSSSRKMREWRLVRCKCSPPCGRCPPLGASYDQPRKQAQPDAGSEWDDDDYELGEAPD
jgi:hypothetical protein